MSAFPFQLHVPTSVRPGTLQRNLLLDLSAAVGLGTAMALVGAMLPSLARHEGLGALGLALLAATPFAASLLSITAGRIGPRTPTGLAILRAVGSAALMLVFFVPGPYVIVLATFIFWAAFALGQPLQQRLWTTMYPSGRRGQLLGIVGTGRFAAGTVALLAVTLLIDGTAGRAVIVIVAAVGAISALASCGLSLPATETQRSFGMAESIRTLRDQPVLRRVTLAQLLYGAGIISAAPLIAMVYVDRLQLGLSEIALAGLTVYATTAIAFGPYGRLANRIGGLRGIAAGGALGAGALLAFAFAPNLIGVLAAAVVLGVASAGINVSWPLILAENASLDEQASVAAGLGTIMGARGMIAPIMMMLAVSAGLLGVSSGLVVCAVISGSGALLYAQTSGLFAFSFRRPTHVRALVAALGSLGALIRL